MSAGPGEAEVVAALRRYGAVHAGMMRSFAAHLAVHPTDAAALAEIFSAEDAGAPLGPAALAQRIGRSRPAVSALLARLEAAGHVRREPSAVDGRGVVLRAGAAVPAATATWFRGYSEALGAVLATAPAGRVAEALEVLDRIVGALAAVEVPDESSSITESYAP